MHKHKRMYDYEINAFILYWLIAMTNHTGIIAFFTVAQLIYGNVVVTLYVDTLSCNLGNKGICAIRISYGKKKGTKLDQGFQ